jgi:hypothetical protein
LNSLRFISFLFFDGVGEISPFSTLKIDRLTNVETFLLSFSSILPVFLSLTSVYLLILCVESYCWPRTNSVTHILTLCMTPLDARSARHRAFFLKIRYSQEKNSRASGGIQTHSPSKGATADLRHSLRGHRNQLLSSLYKKYEMKCF